MTLVPSVFDVLGAAIGVALAAAVIGAVIDLSAEADNGARCLERPVTGGGLRWAG